MVPVFYAGTMSKLPILRSDEKLPRGSYFYIQVGHRFYSGEIAETVEVTVDNQEPVVRYYEKGGKPSIALQRRWEANRANYPFRRGAGRARYERDQRKGSLPTYFKPRQCVEKSTKSEFTGRLSPKLVDTVEEAKKFRRQDRVNSACERLKACYEGLDVKVTIKMEKGDVS